MTYIRIYADQNGETHLQDVTIEMKDSSIA
jgi:hypothetical protein